MTRWDSERIIMFSFGSKGVRNANTAHVLLTTLLRTGVDGVEMEQAQASTACPPITLLPHNGMLGKHPRIHRRYIQIKPQRACVLPVYLYIIYLPSYRIIQEREHQAPCFTRVSCYAPHFDTQQCHYVDSSRRKSPTNYLNQTFTRCIYITTFLIQQMYKIQLSVHDHLVFLLLNFLHNSLIDNLTQ